MSGTKPAASAALRLVQVSLWLVVAACAPAEDADPAAIDTAVIGDDAAIGEDAAMDEISEVNETPEMSEATGPHSDPGNAGCEGSGFPLGGAQGSCFSEAGLDPVGWQPEPIPDAVCACVVATDDRPYSASSDRSDAPPPEPDNRVEELALDSWATNIRRTHCGCCHNDDLKGPGTPFWGVTYEPVFIDSATDRGLALLASLNPATLEAREQTGPGQWLPLPEEVQAAFREVVRAEIGRRVAARERE